jgi:hypothetical protein
MYVWNVLPLVLNNLSRIFHLGRHIQNLRFVRARANHVAYRVKPVKMINVILPVSARKVQKQEQQKSNLIPSHFCSLYQHQMPFMLT